MLIAFVIASSAALNASSWKEGRHKYTVQQLEQMSGRRIILIMENNDLDCTHCSNRREYIGFIRENLIVDVKPSATRHRKLMESELKTFTTPLLVRVLRERGVDCKQGLLDFCRDRAMLINRIKNIIPLGRPRAQVEHQRGEFISIVNGGRGRRRGRRSSSDSSNAGSSRHQSRQSRPGHERQSNARRENGRRWHKRFTRNENERPPAPAQIPPTPITPTPIDAIDAGGPAVVAQSANASGLREQQVFEYANGTTLHVEL